MLYADISSVNGRPLCRRGTRRVAHPTPSESRQGHHNRLRRPPLDFVAPGGRPDSGPASPSAKGKQQHDTIDGKEAEDWSLAVAQGEIQPEAVAARHVFPGDDADRRSRNSRGRLPYGACSCCHSCELVDRARARANNHNNTEPERAHASRVTDRAFHAAHRADACCDYLSVPVENTGR